MGFTAPLFGWMPGPIQVMVVGVLFLFSLIAAARLITFIKNMIPFL